MRSCALPLLLFALRTPGMAQQPPHTSGVPGGAARQTTEQDRGPSMPAMNMDGPQTMQMPGEPEAPAPVGDRPAADGSHGIGRSESQQNSQPEARPPSAGDLQSITHPTATLQEPENPEHHTGQQGLPAPDLLQQEAGRQPMSLEDFVSAAFRTNPTLAQAQAEVRRARQQGRQAGLYPNPSAGYSGEHIRGGAYGGGEQGAYLEQQIVLGGKLGLRRGIYEQQARADQIGAEEQGYRVRASVQQAFYRALACQAEVQVSQRLLRVALDAAETVHQLANIGQADAPDILQSEVEAEQARVDLVRAQRRYLQHFTELATEAGLRDLPPSPLRGDLEHPPEIDAEQQVSAMVDQSPQVKQARQGVAIAEARLKAARREPVPDITIRAGEWWSGERTGGSGEAAGPMSFADASVSLPLWNRNQGNVEAARAELERARQEVARAQLEVQQRAEMEAQDYLTARFEAERYRDELLPRARRACELYRMKYQQMAGSYPQVLVSERTLLQLQAAYLEALNQLWASAIALQNFTLAGGLHAPASTGTDSTALNLPGGGGAQ